MKHMILSFEMKGDVTSDLFLMLWFQKDSLDTVGLRTFRTFSRQALFCIGDVRQHILLMAQIICKCRVLK